MSCHILCTSGRGQCYLPTLPAVIRGDAAFTTMWSGSFDLSHATMATSVSMQPAVAVIVLVPGSLVLIHLLMKYKVHDSISAHA